LLDDPDYAERIAELTAASLRLIVVSDWRAASK
jgi:hypothetical protein